MAKLYFYYSAMNAGKSTALLQSSYNYQERGMNTQLYIPKIDDRSGSGKIASRIGIESEADVFSPEDNLFSMTESKLQENPIHCILVDEAQFLSKAQVYQLGEIVDRLDVPVLAFGLRTDFQGNLFDGSAYLLAWADNLKEIKTICHCGHKAIMVVRTDSEGNPVKEGSQVEVGGNERYVSMCRKHYKEILGL